MPRIAVFTPTRDRGHLIGRAVRSLGRQTWRDFELVVGDDGCTDDTPAVVEREAAGAGVPFRIVNAGGAHLGQPAMRNRLFRESDSEFVAMLDDDDEFLPDRLAVGIRMMEGVPDMAVTGGAALVRDGERGGERIRRKPTGDSGIRRRALGGTPFFHSSVLVRRAHLPADPYDETMERGADSLLWARMARREDLRFANASCATVVVHAHAGQVDRAARVAGAGKLRERMTALNLGFLAAHGGPRDPVVAAWLAYRSVWADDPSLPVPGPERARRAYAALDRRGRRIAGPLLARAVVRGRRWYVPPDPRGPMSFFFLVLALRGERILRGLRDSMRRGPACGTGVPSRRP